MHEHDKIAQRLGMLLTRLYSGEKLRLSDLATVERRRERHLCASHIPAGSGQLYPP